MTIHDKARRLARSEGISDSEAYALLGRKGGKRRARARREAQRLAEQEARFRKMQSQRPDLYS